MYLPSPTLSPHMVALLSILVPSSETREVLLFQDVHGLCPQGEKKLQQGAGVMVRERSKLPSLALLEIPSHISTTHEHSPREQCQGQVPGGRELRYYHTKRKNEKSSHSTTLYGIWQGGGSWRNCGGRVVFSSRQMRVTK
jgi:hypothetical protein